MPVSEYDEIRCGVSSLPLLWRCFCCFVLICFALLCSALSSAPLLCVRACCQNGHFLTAPLACFLLHFLLVLFPLFICLHAVTLGLKTQNSRATYILRSIHSFTSPLWRVCSDFFPCSPQPSTMDQSKARNDHCTMSGSIDCRHWSETGVVEEWNSLLLNHICPA